MTTFNEGKHAGEFLLSEANGTRSRDSVTIDASAGAIPAGRLLGKLTANGKYVAYNNAATDGSQTVAGILYDNVEDLAVDQKAVVVSRDAEVKRYALTGLDSDGEADLLALGILVR